MIHGDRHEPSLRAFGIVLRRHRFLIAVTVLIAVGLGVAYTRYASPVFEAVSVVRFEVEHLDLPQLVRVQASENLIGTEIELLRGRAAAAAVIDSLGLRARLIDPPRERRTRFFDVVRVLPEADSATLVFRWRPDSVVVISYAGSPQPVGFARVGDTTGVANVRFVLAPWPADVSEVRLRVDLAEEAIRRFQSQLRISRPARDADLIAIRTRSDDPVEAAAMANHLARNIIIGRQGFRRGRTEAARVFLQEQADSLGRQLRDAEDDLRSYREREHVVDAPEEARSQLARLADLQAHLAMVRAERDAFARLIEQLRDDTSANQTRSRQLMAFPSLLSNQAASVLLGELAEVETQRAELLIRRVPNDPDVRMLTERIREIEAQLQGIAESFLHSLSNQVAALGGEAGRFAGQLATIPEKELQTARRARDARVLTDLYVLVQTRLKEAEITGAAADPTVRIAEVAAPPLTPVRPRPARNLALSLLAGILIGVGASLARERSDHSVRSRADALAIAGLPVVGAIPRASGRRFAALSWRRRSHPALGARADGRLESNGIGGSHRRREAATIATSLVTHDSPRRAQIESFNQLFANLALAYRQRPLKVIVFTSPISGEGKTLSAINFALTGALRGLRVLLVDADLRRGIVNAVLGCDRRPGFAELLGRTANVEDVVRRVQVGEDESLVVIPSGALSNSSVRVLSIERLHDVLGVLAPQFDLVVIDTPPVNLLADATLLGSAADAVVLVVRAGHTQADDLRYAMDQLEAARAPVIGTLLNDINLRRGAMDDGAYRYLLEADRYHVGSG